MMSGGIVPAPSAAKLPATRPERTGAAAPSMMFARSLSGRSLAFGSDVALELRGGNRLGPSGIVADLDIEWEPEFMGVVAQACADQRVRGRDWFTMPPILLSGPEGAGRTHLARRLANAAGLPHIMFDASTWMFTWRCAGPDVHLPMPITTAMVASGCANPVISVTGAQEASSGMIDLLARLIDQTCNDRFVDAGLGAVVNYSAATWIVQDTAKAVEPSRPTYAGSVQQVHRGVSNTLSRLLQRVQLQDAGPEHYDLLVVDVLAEVLTDLGQPLSPRIDLEELFDRARRWPSPTMRQLYDRIGEIVSLDGEEPPF